MGTADVRARIGQLKPLGDRVGEAEHHHPPAQVLDTLQLIRADAVGDGCDEHCLAAVIADEHHRPCGEVLSSRGEHAHAASDA